MPVPEPEATGAADVAAEAEADAEAELEGVAAADAAAEAEGAAEAEADAEELGEGGGRFFRGGRGALGFVVGLGAAEVVDAVGAADGALVCVGDGPGSGVSVGAAAGVAGVGGAVAAALCGAEAGAAWCTERPPERPSTPVETSMDVPVKRSGSRAAGSVEAGGASCERCNRCAAMGCAKARPATCTTIDRTSAARMREGTACHAARSLSDTIKQAARTEPIPPDDRPNPPRIIGRWDEAEDPLGYGFTAHRAFGAEHPTWNEGIEQRLRSEWQSRERRAEDDWAEVRDLIKYGHDYTPRH